MASLIKGVLGRGAASAAVASVTGGSGNNASSPNRMAKKATLIVRVAGLGTAALLLIVGFISLITARSQDRLTDVWVGCYSAITSFPIGSVEIFALPQKVQRLDKLVAFDRIHNFLQHYQYRGPIYVVLAIPSLVDKITLWPALLLIAVGCGYLFLGLYFREVGELIPVVTSVHPEGDVEIAKTPSKTPSTKDSKLAAKEEAKK